MIPRAARLLLSLACPAEERDELVAGLADEAAEVARARGVAAGRRWYWRQTIASVRPLLSRRVSIAGRNLMVLLRGVPMQNLRSDLTFWLRRVVRRPLLPLIVLATMAAGIAAVTAVFGVADAILFRPLPLPDSGRIVRVYTNLPDAGVVSSVNYLDLTDLARTSQTLVAVAPFLASSATWRTESAPEPLAVARVGERYRDVLGVDLQLGRWFDSSEFAVGADTVAVITDAFWRRAFGGRVDVVDQVIDLDGRRVRIVGVLERRDFLFPAAADLWTPLVVAPDSYLNNRKSVQLAAVARIHAGRSLEHATTEIAAIDHQLRQAFPNDSGQRSLLLRPLHDTLAGPVRPTLLLLVAAVCAVLLIAAANVADLLVGDAAARQHEFAIRLAIGAASARLTWQVLAETCALVGLGGLLGLAIAPALTTVLVASYPTPLPRVAEIGLDARAFGVAFVATLLFALVAIVPLTRVSRRVALSAGLNSESRGTTSRGTRRLTAALVMIQVALSVMLLSSGALLLRTFVATSRSQVGFTSSGVLVFNVSVTQARYPDPPRIARFYADLIDRVRAVAGVRAVGATMFLPFAPGIWGDTFARVGEPDVKPNLPDANVQFITPTFPEALGIATRTGRPFTDRDTMATPKVALVNETLQRRSFGGRAVGRRITWNDQTWEIVGVLADTRHASLTEPAAPELYFPWTQFPINSGWVVVKADNAQALAPMIPLIRDQLHALDSTVPMTRVSLMDARLADVMAPERFRATLAGTLGLSAVLLAVLGLYGMLAHRVARQTREIGVRLALGEPAARIRRSIVMSALRVSSAGVIAGLAASIWSASLIQGLLTAKLRARDPITLGMVSLAILGIAVAAAWVPAVRASRVDPLMALRVD